MTIRVLALSMIGMIHAQTDKCYGSYCSTKCSDTIEIIINTTLWTRTNYCETFHSDGTCSEFWDNLGEVTYNNGQVYSSNVYQSRVNKGYVIVQLPSSGSEESGWNFMNWRATGNSLCVGKDADSFCDPLSSKFGGGYYTYGSTSYTLGGGDSRCNDFVSTGNGLSIVHHGLNPHFNQPLVSVSADPHVSNFFGKHFMVSKSGRFNILGVRDADGGVMMSVVGDFKPVEDKPCAPSFIRGVHISGSSLGTSVQLSRGNSVFHESEISDEFNINANGSWVAFNDAPDRISVGNATLAKRMQPNSAIIVETKPADVLVMASSSQLGKRHYLDVSVMRVEANSHDISGLMWNDDQALYQGCV